MNRVSTFGNYQSALLDLMAAQTRAQDAQERVSTQKVATDLSGFGRGSETLTALKSTQSRIQGFIDTGETVAARLSTQDLALDRVAEGVSGAREAIAAALASGRTDGLMLELQGHYQITQDGLNSRHLTMADLADLPAASDAFANDTLKQVSRLDEGTLMETGFLANEVGQAAFDIFRDIQLFHEATPVSGGLDDATRDFLTAQLTRLDEARETVTNFGARNGSLQNRVDSILTAQTTQKVSLDEMLAKKTDADLAQALTDLELSQVAIQASAQVINQLRQVSLLNFLS
jgi:flagellar hook-associated protein 3 FlgL